MGMGEFFLIIAVGFLLFKPKELPALLLAMGKILRKLRKFSLTVTDYFEQTVQQHEAQEYEERTRQHIIHQEKNGRKKNLEK